MKQPYSNKSNQEENDVTDALSHIKQSICSRIKSSLKLSAILVVLILSFGVSPKQLYAQQADVSLQLFYDQLSPYGQWIDHPQYGYVWLPNAGQDFVPYSTNGHWVMTDDGWTWASDYEWGWAPFHYGRWDYDDSYGWLWVPGTEWGPSWVDWRSADGYYGWSPMEPGISLSVGFGRPYNSNYDHWMFVRSGDFDRSDINHYYVNRTDHDRLVRSSIVINKTYVDNSRHSTYAFGPARADVQKATGRTVNRVAIQENTKPGQSMHNGQLSMYRPKMTTNNTKGQKPVPVKIANLKDVKHPAGTNPANQDAKVTPANKINSKVQPSQSKANAQNPNKKVQSAQTQNAAQNNNIYKAKAAQPQKVNSTVVKTANTKTTAVKSAIPAQKVNQPVNRTLNTQQSNINKTQATQPRKVNPAVTRPVNQQNKAGNPQSQQQRTANQAIRKPQPKQQQPKQQQQPQQQRPQQQPQQQPRNESTQENRQEQPRESKP